jgi:hypothetical protein
MWNRTNRALGLLLGLQVVAFGLMAAFCGPGPSSRVPPRMLFEGFRIDELQTVRLQSGEPPWDAGADAALPEPLVIARQGEGWVLPGKFDHPADRAKLERLLGQLVGLASSLVVARGPEHQVALEVAEGKFRRKLTLEAAGRSRELYVGGRKAGFTQVRVGGEDAVYAVDDLDEWQLGPTASEWLAKGGELAPPERVQILELERQGRALRLARVGPEDWRLGEEAVPAGKARALLDQAVRLEPADVLGRLDDPAARARVDQGQDPVVVRLGLRAEPWGAPGTGPADAVPDGGASPAAEVVETKVIHLAAHPERSSQALAYLEGGGFVLVVDRWRVERLLELDPVELVKPEQPPGFPGLPASDEPE